REPTGMSWEQYCEAGMYYVQPFPEKHLIPDADGKPRGFATTTGKIELASEVLDMLGGQRLPEQGELVRLCSPELIERAEAQGACLVSMITGSRKQPYNASMYLENPDFRKRSPRPVVEMSEATALKLGLSEGDTAKLETDYGCAHFTVSIVRMRDDLVNVDYGWWHPEWGVPKEPDLGGIYESNVNCLTTCTPREPLIGTWAYNALDCMISKDNDFELTWE
ncbi:MAG: hypothetical protein IJH04_01285, partial [Eggerthellaceae bacterium]|nr:hypothetical protein [Eggerthellaceae bacterium]